MLQKFILNCLILLTITSYLLPVSAYAQTPTPDQSCDPGKAGDCPAGIKDLENIFANVISVVVGLGFIALLILIIATGFKYLTSGGEPKAVAVAHQTVTWALLGVVFMAVAWIVLQLIHVFTGINVTIFKFSLPS